MVERERERGGERCDGSVPAIIQSLYRSIKTTTVYKHMEFHINTCMCAYQSRLVCESGQLIKSMA